MALVTTSSEDYARIERRLDRLGRKWQPRMGLDHIEIMHHYLDVSSAFLLGAGVKNMQGAFRCSYGAPSNAAGRLSYTACVETRWNYQLADVYFLMPAVITWSADQLERILVHEYAHILTAVEQYLLEVRLSEVAAEDAMTTSEIDGLCTLYYERMEMATENVARAVLSGWRR